jgi:hypothetical protein
MTQATGEQFIAARLENNSKACIYMTPDASVASAEISSTWGKAESQAMIPAAKMGADLTKQPPPMRIR